MLAQRSLVIATGMAIAVAGCASYKPAPLSPSANATALERRNLDDARLHDFLSASLGPEHESGLPDSWSLSNLSLAAVYFHPDLDIAQAKLAAARAGVITARQRPNPYLSFTGVFGTAAVAATAIAPEISPITIGPVINFLIESFGKRETRVAGAQHLAESVRWDLATAGWQVRGRVRTALISLWAAKRRLELTNRRLALQDQLVQLLEQAFALGEASSLDVTRERINRTQITLAIRDLERAAADAQVQLATAIGVPARALDSAKLSLDAFDQPPPIPIELDSGPLRQKALTERTDVQARMAEYDSAQSALQLQVANQYPNVTLGSGYNYDFGTNKYILGVGMELPIFHQNQGPIAEAFANREQSAANFTSLQAQVIGAIDQAAAAYRAATRSVATGDRLLGDSQRRTRQVETAFRAGQVDRPTLVTAQLEEAATALSRFDAVVQQRQAIGALEDALQYPLFDPGQWPTVPEQSPRLANKGPRS